jgi:hypothetical protein
MMHRIFVTMLAASMLAVPLLPMLAAEGGAARGDRVFCACAPCHSLEAAARYSHRVPVVIGLLLVALGLWSIYFGAAGQT